LDRGGRRPHELAHLLELGHHGLALYPELLRELVYPDLRHCAPSTRSDSAGPLSRSGQRVLRPASASAVHRRMLLGRSPQSQPAPPGRVAPALLCSPARSPRPASPRPAATRQLTALQRTALSRLAKILGKPAGSNRSRQSQRPRECPPAL